jgi:hypothetical protein
MDCQEEMISEVTLEVEDTKRWLTDCQEEMIWKEEMISEVTLEVEDADHEGWLTDYLEVDPEEEEGLPEDIAEDIR